MRHMPYFSFYSTRLLDMSHWGASEQGYHDSSRKTTGRSVHLVGDCHGDLSVAAHDGAHGVDALHDPRQHLGAAARRDLHAVAHQERLRDELRAGETCSTVRLGTDR